MKVDPFLEELILYLYYFENYSVREIVKELKARTNVQLSHAGVHKVIKRSQRKDFPPELLEWVRSLSESMKPRELEYATATAFAENENFRALVLKKEDLEQKLNLDGRIHSVFFDRKTKQITIVYEQS